jgi:hypothetical protein
MTSLAYLSASRRQFLGRLMLATLSQYTLIIMAGALLSLIIGTDFNLITSTEEPIEGAELLSTLFLTAYFALYLSWPSFLVLLITLGLLRGSGRPRPAGQRWALLLTGLTLGIFSTLLHVREAWTEIIELDLLWVVGACGPWILAAYAVVLGANRPYLGPAM